MATLFYVLCWLFVAAAVLLAMVVAGVLALFVVSIIFDYIEDKERRRALKDGQK